MIPSGTVLTIRMVDSVDSERDRVGQTFKASLDEPVLDPSGRTLVPRGADVVVKLVDDQQSGKIEGRTVLTLDIVSLRIDGRQIDVDTTAITQESGSRRSEERQGDRRARRCWARSSAGSRAAAKARRSDWALALARARRSRWPPRASGCGSLRRRG